MEREMKAHETNKSWTLVSRESIVKKEGRKTFFISSLWRYRIKTQNGAITSYKARLCANGASMRCDPHDTFSPTAGITTIRTMFALAAAEGVTIYTGDVPSAYVKANVPEDMDIYMTQPKGFEIEGKETWYARLDKALYGIPPAGQCWYDDCSAFLKSIGFKQSRADPCIFIKSDEDGKMVISLTVDDFLEFATSSKLQEETRAMLLKKFQYINNGPATWFLGIGVTQTCETISLSQVDFIQGIVKQHPKVKEQDCPAEQGSYLEPNEGPKEDFPYRSLCGRLRYATITRPEIEHSLNQCCRFQENPGKQHVKALLRIVGFLKKYPDRPLIYRKNTDGLHDPILLDGIADSSHADDTETRRSSYGYFARINGCPVAWKSRTTPTVATSVAEAEYVALSECLKELLHLKGLLEELGYQVKTPYILRTDSLAAKGIAEYARVTNRSKHIDIRYHFLRERVAAKEVEVEHVPTEKNIADIFTKNLGPSTLWKLLDLI
jgi:hypothetical protein